MRPVNVAATAAEIAASRARSRRSTVLTARSLRHRGIVAQPGPDADVGPAALLEVGRAADTLQPVAGALRDPLRGGVRDVDVEHEPDQAELVEPPAREELDRAAGDAAPARGRSDGVADLALAGLQVELDDRGEGEEARRRPTSRATKPAQLPSCQPCS